MSTASTSSPPAATSADRGRISARNAGVLFSARLIIPAVTFSLYLVVDLLGEKGALGLYYEVYNVITLFQVLANFGYDMFLMREVAATPERAKRLLTNSIAMLIPYGILLAVTMPQAAWVSIGKAEIVHPLWAGALAIPFMVLAYALEAVLIGQERFKTILAGASIDATLRLTLSVWALSEGWGVQGLMLALAASRASAVLFYLIRLWPNPGLFPPELSRGVLKELLQGASLFFVIYINYALVTRLDGVLLARFHDPVEGDAYALPNRLAISVWLFSGSVIGSIYPAMSRAAGTARLGAIVVQTSRLFLIPSLAASALLSCYASEAMTFLAFKESTEAASAPVMVWMAWLMVPLMLNEPVMRGLLAARGQRTSVLISFVVVAIAVVLLYWWIRDDGALGAARAVPIVVACDWLLNTLALSRRTDLRRLPGAFLRIGLAGLITIPGLFWLAPRIGLLAAPVFLAAYLLALLATKGLSVSELRDPRQMLRF